MTEENNAKNINLLVPLISIGQVTQNIQNFKGVLKYDRQVSNYVVQSVAKQLQTRDLFYNHGFSSILENQNFILIL